MHYQIHFRNNDYNFAFDSFEADSLEAAIAETRKKLREYKALDCTIYVGVAYLDDADSDVVTHNNE